MNGYPWQKELWQRVNQLYQTNHLPHALLLTGPEGVGKRVFAHAYAHFILCQDSEKTTDACGCCRSCQLMAATSHPDFHLIQPEQEGQAIKIDQIRQLMEFIQNTSHQGGYRVILIQPVEAMNIHAANALLKTLEEPTPYTLMMLISDQKSSLPATIISRCQRIHCAPPPRAEALAWLCAQSDTPSAETAQEDFWAPLLESTNGAPLLAKQWHEQGVWPVYQNFMRDLSALSTQQADPLTLAVQWKEVNMLWVFDLFFQWLLRCLWAQHHQHIAHDIPEEVLSASLLEFIDYLQQLRVETLGSYHLNQQLLLESLFIRWSYYVSR